MNLEVSFHRATEQDVLEMVELINSAYRGEVSRLGWTTEADLLDGRRTDVEDVLNLLAGVNAMFLLARVGKVLQGSVLLQYEDEAVHVGMLAVNPVLQGRGIGKALLSEAERVAQQTWAVKRLLMSVISCRHELIAFYQRRGYLCTGISKEFPVNAALWTAKVDNLHFDVLEKLL